MKRILLLLLCMVILTVPCYAAEVKEIIAEGTYIMTENDTPALAEEAALTAAKRAALEQASGIRMSSNTIKDDQIRSLSVGVIQAEVIDKNHTYNGQSLVFSCKIKAIVSTDKLTEAIERWSTSLEKPVMGVVTIATLEPKAKYDVHIPTKKNYGKKMEFPDFLQEYHVSEPYNRTIIDKYTSRSLVVETNDSLAKSLQENKEINTDILTTLAAKYNYDYIWVNDIKFKRIERITGTAFFTLSMKMYWQLDVVNNYYLYDAKNNKIIFNNTILEKREQQFPAGGWLDMNPDMTEDKALKIVLKDIAHSAFDKLKFPAL